MKVGQIIKNARIAKGYTQEELGRIIGVQKSAVAKYESGRVVNIKRSVLKKLSEELEIAPFHLVEIEEVPCDAAMRDADIISNADMQDIYNDFIMLDENQKKVVKKLIHCMAEEKRNS